MKKTMILLLTVVAFFITIEKTFAFQNAGLVVYGTYWHDEENPGYGIGAKYNEALYEGFFMDARFGYTQFESIDLKVMPMEATINFAIPGKIAPYIGIGGGYYYIDSSIMDDKLGWLGQVGIEYTVMKYVLVAEVQYHDFEGTTILNETYSGNIGLRLNF